MSLGLRTLQQHSTRVLGELQYLSVKSKRKKTLYILLSKPLTEQYWGELSRQLKYMKRKRSTLVI
jgi:hypothetical protein